MRRIILISTISLVLMCSCVVVAGFAVYQQSTMSVSALPLYPGAFNVQRAGLPGMVSGTPSGSSGITFGQTSTGGQSWSVSGSGYEALRFETTDSTQSVYTYYDRSFRGAGWASTSGGQGPSVYTKLGPPDFAHIEFLGFQGSFVPVVHVPRVFYFMFVNADSTGTNTQVDITLVGGN